MPHVYAHASTLCFFHNLVSTQTFQRELTASVDSCGGDKERPLSGVTNYRREVA